ncbi:hypothetical protein [Synechococcus sp. A15-28]|uniref:hypothetical protein n=1 Tax=Synechococcus sp. A15-28 TaxID=1050638 RepID=UPI001648AA63|nr:hypothetical protein [Synechococcus sp. A15-28]
MRKGVVSSGDMKAGPTLRCSFILQAISDGCVINNLVLKCIDILEVGLVVRAVNQLKLKSHDLRINLKLIIR